MRLLSDMGYTRVSEYVGGMAEWSEAGRDIEPAGMPSRSSSTTSRRPRSLVARWLGSGIHGIADSSTGSLVLMWLAVVFGSGLAYWLASAVKPVLSEGGELLQFDMHGLMTSLYFSFVCATSIGFGDVVPLGFARILAVLEAIAGLMIFGALVSKLVSRRQEALVEEIHRVTHEQRLSRVRSNLQSVLSELQALLIEKTDSGVGGERGTERLEAAAMTFATELHAVHDLLYRPRLLPDESSLAVILAAMEADLRTLRDVLEGVTHRSEVLSAELAQIALLASEICGDCVPHEYEADLRGWMDRIQSSGRALAAASTKSKP